MVKMHSGAVKGRQQSNGAKSRCSKTDEEEWNGVYVECPQFFHNQFPSFNYIHARGVKKNKY